MKSLIRIEEVERRVQMSRTEIYRLIREGQFPRNIKRGARVLWVEQEIDAYVEALIKRRDGTPEPAAASE
jgi:prophage regulatory protein